jgi:hypothetical protein
MTDSEAMLFLAALDVAARRWMISAADQALAAETNCTLAQRELFVQHDFSASRTSESFSEVHQSISPRTKHA